jgi:ABC-2 type transport system ATP-binding protein
MVHAGPVNDVGRGAEMVEVNADVDNLNETLMKFSGVASVSRENGFFQVTLRDEFHGKDLNKFLVDQGIVVNHLVTKKKSLEKMFLEILSESN